MDPVAQVKSLVEAFSDAAEKGSSAFLMGFGAALLVVLSFVESQLGGAPLVAAIAGAALVMVTGGVLRVSALWVSSQAATRVKVATIERAFESAETPVELPKGT